MRACASIAALIYVDQDISLLRGWLQGWPKKIGQTWLTRSMPLIHPAAARVVGRQPIGRESQREGAAARQTLRSRCRARRPGAWVLLAAPTIGAIGWPT